jgi:serine/threonine protein kinase
MLGEGGFGEVWMCANQLDDQQYAIKKIRLDPKDEAMNRKMLREVMSPKNPDFSSHQHSALKL